MARKPEITGDFMIMRGYLIISENGKLEIRPRRPTLKGGQIACILQVMLPKEIFELYYPTVEITMDAENTIQPAIEVRAMRTLKKL